MFDLFDLGLKLLPTEKRTRVFHYFRSKHTLAFISYYFLFNLLKYSTMRKFNFNNLSPTHTNLYSVQPRLRLRNILRKSVTKVFKIWSFFEFQGLEFNISLSRY